MAERVFIFAVLTLALSACASDGTPAGNRCNPMNPSGCGNGGVGGSAGEGGAGGGGGTGGDRIILPPPCQTSTLCRACPAAESYCDSESDCGLGFSCIVSGCATPQGESIGVCVLEPAGFCDTECADPDRVCTDLGSEGRRCVKTTPGCEVNSDCITGFFCESGQCVDRRVPCDLDRDCPVNFVCEAFGTTELCIRIHQECEKEFDCAGIAPRCEDIDGDGRKECAAPIDPNAPSPTACVNSRDCLDPERPVCEASDDLGSAVCGQYGLCRPGQADCADGFECALLWPDGRRECIPSGDCTSTTDCPARQVCAASRTDGSVACQSGRLSF